MSVSQRRGKWVADFRDSAGTRHWITRSTRVDAERALRLAKTIMLNNNGVYRSGPSLMVPKNDADLIALYERYLRRIFGRTLGIKAQYVDRKIIVAKILQMNLKDFIGEQRA